ncbi:DnaB-like helicase C-terminal domain-containing protein [Azospirillum argentinense]|nr:DnaB-like helicase C-terminal domain-containing protein [Azospirillum argentinense]
MPDGSTLWSIIGELPHNEEAEQGLLGALLINNRLFPKVAGFLRPEHFYDPVHQCIYAAIATLIERGDPATPPTLAPFFADDPDLQANGGAGYLAQLVGGEPIVANVEYYGRTILDHYQRARLIEVAGRALEEARRFRMDVSAADIIGTMEANLMALEDSAPQVKPLVTVRAAVEEAIAAADGAARAGTAISGITTGLKDLDWRTGGLQRGELIIIGARPSMGKSDLAWNIAVNAARVAAAGGYGGARVLVFSQEMPPRQLGARLLAREAGVPTDRQRRGEVTDAEFVRFAQAIPDLPLWLDGTSRVTPAYVMRRARRLQRRHRLDLIVIDHLAIMGAPDGFRHQGDTAVVTEITRELKGVATSLDVPVLLLSQLSRQVEMREDKRPTLSDLRQSGSIEQDADTVMFLYRDEYYLRRAEPVRRQGESDDTFNARCEVWQQQLDAALNVAEVIVAKQRMGPIGTVSLHYDGAYSAFSDLDHSN